MEAGIEVVIGAATGGTRTLERVVQAVLRIGLGNAVAAAALATLAVLSGRLLRRPAVTHALWVLVLLKLLTPPLWTVPVRLATPESSKPITGGLAESAALRRRGETAGAMARTATPRTGEPRPVQQPKPLTVLTPSHPEAPNPAAVVHAESADRTGPAASVAQDGHFGSLDADVALEIDSGRADRPAREDPGGAASPEPVARAAATAVPPHPWWDSIGPWLWRAAAAVWGLGSVACLAVAAARVMRFRRCLRHAVVAPPAVQAQTRAVARRMGVSRPPPVWLVPGAVSPMLWAFGPARLLVPVQLWERLDERQRATLLAHELAHLCRRDHWVRWLELAATVLYWWHPACWLARGGLREAEEQCCDAWVLWAEPNGLHPYTAALLETLDFLSARHPNPDTGPSGPGRGRATAPPTVPVLASGMGQFGQFGQLKRRFIMLKQGNVPRALTRGGLLAVCGLGALVLPVLPTVGQVANGPKTDAPRSDAQPAQVAATTSAATTGALTVHAGDQADPTKPGVTVSVTASDPFAKASVVTVAKPAAPGEVAVVSVTTKDDSDDKDKDGKEKQDKDADRQKAEAKRRVEEQERRAEEQQRRAEEQARRAEEQARRAKEQAERAVEQAERQAQEKKARADKLAADADDQAKDQAKEKAKEQAKSAKDQFTQRALQARDAAIKRELERTRAQIQELTARLDEARTRMKKLEATAAESAKAGPGDGGSARDGDGAKGPQPNYGVVRRGDGTRPDVALKFGTDDRDRRLEAVERQLEALMREVKALRSQPQTGTLRGTLNQSKSAKDGDGSSKDEHDGQNPARRQ